MGHRIPIGKGPEARFKRLEFEGIDHAQELAAKEGWAARFLPISVGAQLGTYHSLDLPGIYLAQKTYRGWSYQVSGSAPRSRIPLVLPIDTGKSLRCQGERVSAHEAIMIDRGQGIDLTIEGGGQAVLLYLTEDTYLAILRAVAGPDAEPTAATDGIRVIDGPGLALLKTRLNELFQTDGNSSLLGVQGLSRYVTSLLVTALCSVERDRPQALSGPMEQKTRYARLARDVMQKNQHEPLVLTELGIEVGISVRTLHYAFQDYFGVSPGRYHKLQRLAAARNELMRIDPSEASVTEVATRWGFYHLGRFAQAYDQHFGELPSQTLTQRKSQHFLTRKRPAAR